MKEMNVDICNTFSKATKLALDAVEEPSFFMFNGCRIELTTQTTRMDIQKQYENYWNEIYINKEKNRRSAIKTILLLNNLPPTLSEVKDALITLDVSEYEINSVLSENK